MHERSQQSEGLSDAPKWVYYGDDTKTWSDKELVGQKSLQSQEYIDLDTGEFCPATDAW